MNKFFKYFIQGIIIVVPLAITLFVVYKIISTVASMLAIAGIIIHPLIDPILVLIVVIIIIFLIGLLGSNYLVVPILARMERNIERAPLIKIIYSSIKDFLSAFVGSKKRFNKPVMVTIDKANDIQQIGFITQTNLTELDITGKVAVYMPLSYAISGKLIIVPASSVIPLNIPAAEAMKFIVSGGVTDID